MVPMRGSAMTHYFLKKDGLCGGVLVYLIRGACKESCSHVGCFTTRIAADVALITAVAATTASHFVCLNPYDRIHAGVGRSFSHKLPPFSFPGPPEASGAGDEAHGRRVGV